MSAVITPKFRIFNAKKFIASLASENLYVGIGKPDVWAADDSAPETVKADLSYRNIAYQSLTDMKKINPATEISHVMPKHDFDSSATDFVPWNSNSATAFDDKFYCITTTTPSRVYKCVGKDASVTGGPGLPTGSATTPQLVAGYWWQYMFESLGTENDNFRTTVFAPVQTATAASTRLTHQNACKAAAANTGIYYYEVVNGGSGYGNTATLTCNVYGDGTGAVATLKTNSSGVITGYTITTAGTGYTYAAVENISGGGSGAIIRPSVAPGLGHGTDPVEELGGHYIVAHTLLAGSAATVDNDFRQLSLILNPIEDDGTTAAGGDDYRPMRRLTVTAAESLTFAVDEIITEATSGAQGRIVDKDTTNGYIYYVQSDDYSSSNVAITTGTGFKPFTGGLALSSTTGAAASSTLTVSPIKTGSGDIVFLENLASPVDRGSNQTEDIKIVIEF